MASFAKRVATTYVTFVGANALSNFVLFPSYKLDYGILNEYISLIPSQERPTGNKW